MDKLATCLIPKPSVSREVSWTGDVASKRGEPVWVNEEIAINLAVNYISFINHIRELRVPAHIELQLLYHRKSVLNFFLAEIRNTQIALCIIRVGVVLSVVVKLLKQYAYFHSFLNLRFDRIYLEALLGPERKR
jgi:hypothetical protein